MLPGSRGGSIVLEWGPARGIISNGGTYTFQVLLNYQRRLDPYIGLNSN